MMDNLKGVLIIVIFTAVLSVGIILYSCFDIFPLGYEGKVTERVREICTYNGIVLDSCADKKLNIHKWCSFLHE